MRPTTPLDPSSMSADARVAEVAATLSRALLRLRTLPNPNVVRAGQEPLGFSPPQRVHSNPAARVRKAVRAAAVQQQQGV
ncbi:hypothetical protein FUT89_10235 [Ralstonia pseudosolanacearum]|uniref:Uncharacterized protein n=1 Tax=Ralstonia solanacearum TaxID=305 RepID=A0A0S4X3N5_RALSL|nr:hypothetical protein CIG66_18830 [Ralstonia pseudosolanacearum]AXV71529.1 hypothetical protein CJO74_19685 [Ralstonia solanacearum]AXW36177.1 hypothetical protein CJO88_23200 [Ralstonia solanacearum]RAA08893.1 hypothetical protein DOT79_22890 [Ralstonia pseudosolanacearum]TXD92329.1 hypothetical protein FUT89_10235 [Ralstonia pseudosolanacearum]